MSAFAPLLSPHNFPSRSLTHIPAFPPLFPPHNFHSDMSGSLTLSPLTLSRVTHSQPTHSQPGHGSLTLSHSLSAALLSLITHQDHSPCNPSRQKKPLPHLVQQCIVRRGRTRYVGCRCEAAKGGQNAARY